MRASVRQLSAGQLAAAVRGYQALAPGESRKHFHLAARALAQRNETQVDQTVGADYVYALHLSTVEHGGFGHDDALVLAAREVRASEEARAQLRITRQFDLHDEGAAGGIGGRNDLRDLAAQLAVYRIDDHGRR